VAVVDSAATADDVDRGGPIDERPAPGAELERVTVVELVGVVELGMTSRGGIDADALDPVERRVGAFEDVREVRWVRAVDHEIGRGCVRLGVGLLDSLRKALPVRQAPVRLDREGHRDRKVGGPRGANDADRLLRVRHRQARHHVGGRLA
jgi:hypothetical protein